MFRNLSKGNKFIKIKKMKGGSFIAKKNYNRELIKLKNFLKGKKIWL